MESSFNSNVAQSEFMNLLTVQLRNQDPIEPVDQEQFVSQLTQFSILEGIENMNARFDDMLFMQELSQGTDLIGRDVQYQDSDTGELSSGTVDGFFVENSRLFLRVGDKDVPISQTVAVK